MTKPDLPAETHGGVSFIRLYGELHALVPEAAQYMGYAEGHIHNLVSAGRLDRRPCGRFSAITKKSMDAYGDAVLKRGAA